MFNRSRIWLIIFCATLLAASQSQAHPAPDAPKWTPTFTADFTDAKSLESDWLPRWCEPKIVDGKLVIAADRKGRGLDYFDALRFPKSVRVEMDVTLTPKANTNTVGFSININSDGYASGTGYCFQFTSASSVLRREAGSYEDKTQQGITDGSHLNQPIDATSNNQIRAQANKLHHLIAQREGNHLSFWVDGALAYEYEDAKAVPIDPDRGFVGLVARGCTITLEKFVIATRAGEEGAIIKPVDPPQGTPITIMGVASCSRSSSSKEDEGIHIVQVYAYDGSGDIKDRFNKMMDEYFPADHGMNVQESQAFQRQFDKQLRYNIADRHITRITHDEAHFQSQIVKVTGTLYQQDGQRWIYPTEIKNIGKSEEDLRKDPSLGFFRFPEKMLAADKPFLPAGKTPLEIKITDTISMKCILLPAGSFMQGSPYYQPYRWQDEFYHEVVLTKPFYFAQHPVTQEMYEAIMNKNPSKHIGPKFAVEHVPFADIDEFCKIVSQKNGRTVRLPTDAEWEYAARVGTSGPCFTEKYLSQFNQATDKGYGTPQPVMFKAPNAWGIYDMLGAAWTVDSEYAANNSRVKTIDQTGPARDDPKVRDYGDGPVRKAKGGEYYGDWRPSMHGAADDKGNGAEGTTIFTIVVEATPQEIESMKQQAK